jgi:hypothetical protein
MKRFKIYLPFFFFVITGWLFAFDALSLPSFEPLAGWKFWTGIGLLLLASPMLFISGCWISGKVINHLDSIALVVAQDVEMLASKSPWPRFTRKVICGSIVASILPWLMALIAEK